jgi:hypothetical protein
LKNESFEQRLYSTVRVLQKGTSGVSHTIRDDVKYELFQLEHCSTVRVLQKKTSRVSRMIGDHKIGEIVQELISTAFFALEQNLTVVT